MKLTLEAMSVQQQDQNQGSARVDISSQESPRQPAAYCNAELLIKLTSRAGAWIISEAHVSYGGVAPKTIMATETMAALVGHPLSDDTLQAALKAVAVDVNITPNAPGRNSLQAPRVVFSKNLSALASPHVS